MIKLFSMFVRYAQLPEKEFAKLSSDQIFTLAEFAEKYRGNNVSVDANDSSLKLKINHHSITVTAETANRQLCYQNSLSGEQRYNYAKSMWVNAFEKDIKSVLEKDIKELIRL
jgi:frataxin-like iron-binding protein CyaY